MYVAIHVHVHVRMCMYDYLTGDGGCGQDESFVKSRWDDPSEEKLGVYPTYI